MGSNKVSSRECKDDESMKTILPHEDGYYEEDHIEHIVKLEDYNEMYENKEYLTQIKEETDIPELKYPQININENKQKVEHFECMKVKKEEVAMENKIYTPTCQTCNEKFAKDEELNEHYRHKESHKPKRYLCVHCKKSFDYLTELRSHKAEDHNEQYFKKNKKTSKKTYICELCEREFSNSTVLRIHMITHTMEKHFLCEHCGKLYTSNGALAFHRYKKHELKTGEIPKKYIVKRDFECNICKQKYHTRSGLNMHMLIHKKEYNFLCNFCGRRFLSKNSLEAHIRSHTGSKSHKCSLCGKYFASKGYLKIHKCVRLIENKSSKVQKKITCYSCHKNFYKKNGSARHYCEYVRVTDACNSEQKKFICGYCNREYSRICNLSDNRLSNKQSNL